MLPSPLMSPNNFSTAAVDPSVVALGTIPAWKPPSACTGAPAACAFPNTAVNASLPPVVQALFTADVHAVTVTASCRLVHEGDRVSLQPESMVSFSPTNRPAAELITGDA